MGLEGGRRGKETWREKQRLRAGIFRLLIAFNNMFVTDINLISILLGEYYNRLQADHKAVVQQAGEEGGEGALGRGGRRQPTR